MKNAKKIKVAFKDLTGNAARLYEYVYGKKPIKLDFEKWPEFKKKLEKYKYVDVTITNFRTLDDVKNKIRREERLRRC